MSEHREWDEHYAYFQRHEELRNEHNATVRAYRDAMAECERLGKANGEACDRIHALEKWKQETLDENNRLDRELDEARQSLKALESRPVLTWEECEEEFYHVCGHFPNSSQGSFMGWLKSRLPAPTDSIPVPFSDAQIDAMAKAARRVLLGSSETDANWPLWHSAIRAALAAGGLEPCAGHIVDANKMVPERASDEELAELHYEHRRKANKDWAVMSWIEHREDHPNRHREYIDATAAVRARVEAPLLAEIAEHRRHVGIVMSREAALKAELRASSAENKRLSDMYGLGYAQSVTAERDTLKARVEELESDLNSVTKHQELCAAKNLEYSAELEAVKVENAALRQPVDADAWKTPLRIVSNQIIGSEFWVEVRSDMAFAACMTSPRNGTGFHFHDPADAARVAAHLASYAVAHGCPVGFGEDRESLVNALIEAKRQRDELACKLIAKNPSEPVYGGWHFEDGYKIAPNGEPSKNTGELPAEPVSDTYKLPTPSGAQVEALPETPKGLPDIDHLEAIFDNTYGATKSDKKALEAVVTELRPWLREPTGWELDVTAGEIMQACTTNLNGYEVALELCRSRIRPTFECAECAGWKAKYLEASKHADDMHARNKAARAALAEEKTNGPE